MSTLKELIMKRIYKLCEEHDTEGTQRTLRIWGCTTERVEPEHCSWCESRQHARRG